MSKIKLTCDSTCDLTKELYEKCNAEITPMGVSLGDDFRRDGINIEAEEIFEYVKNTGELPKTSAISVGEYIDIFKKYTDDGYQVVHISLSSELSASYHNACLAAEELGNIVVIDSKSLSTGSGHLVIAAADMIESGLSIFEIEKELNNLKEKLDVSFVLQTLDYIHKGGRCSGITLLGANLLKIRPEIEVIDGKMIVGKKYRGNLMKSVSDYVNGRLKDRSDISLKRIFITHSGVNQDVIDHVVSLVKELQPFEEVIVTNAGCTISSHCGPDCLGVLFFRK